MKQKFIDKARSIYGEGYIPLHRPIFAGNEKKALLDCLESNFVSTVGKMVDEFEQSISCYTGAKYAIATVNGTAALHIALLLAGVERNDEVITQAVSFVATCNAISYCGADPIFVDVDIATASLSPTAINQFLDKHAEIIDGQTYNKNTGRRIAACVPMHTFGIPSNIAEIMEICSAWSIPVVEDTAESLGSFVGRLHTGRFGALATFSFNGNKIVTTGGGGMIITDRKELAIKARHLTTTAKVPHPYEFIHDQVGYNYRMPNLNAALGCAQMEYLNKIIDLKQKVTTDWMLFFAEQKLNYLKPAAGTKSNNWLNSIILSCKEERDDFLRYTNNEGVMTRPMWTLLSDLQMFKHCQSDGLKNSRWLEERVVNIPSSVPSIS